MGAEVRGQRDILRKGMEARRCTEGIENGSHEWWGGVHEGAAGETTSQRPPASCSEISALKDFESGQ